MSRNKTEFIKLKKTDLIKNRPLIAIDCGTSLTKVLFVNKNCKEEFLNENVTHLTLEFHLFRNDDIENAVEFVKSNALQIEDEDGVHITGVFASKYRNKIKSILNKETILIDKEMAIKSGYKVALEQIGIENMHAPNMQVEGYGEIASDMIDKWIESVKSKFQTNDNLLRDASSPYPCIFSLNGTCSSSLYFHSNGTCEFYKLPNQNGKLFLGLAKCLLDTNEYDKIIELASLGNRSNVDTIVKDIMDASIDSPYGKFPQDLPIFSFGKCADNNKGLSDFSKEDVAMSLVSFYAYYLVFHCGEICGFKKISKVYLTGNLFNSNIFQKEIQKILLAFPLGIEFVFLKFGYYGVLGAMFCDGNSVLD